MKTSYFHLHLYQYLYLYLLSKNIPDGLKIYVTQIRVKRIDP